MDFGLARIAKEEIQNANTADPTGLLSIELRMFI
jgi:hypothetical protein